MRQLEGSLEVVQRLIEVAQNVEHSTGIIMCARFEMPVFERDSQRDCLIEIVECFTKLTQTEVSNTNRKQRESAPVNVAGGFEKRQSLLVFFDSRKFRRRARLRSQFSRFVEEYLASGVAFIDLPRFPQGHNLDLV